VKQKGQRRGEGGRKDFLRIQIGGVDHGDAVGVLIRDIRGGLQRIRRGARIRGGGALWDRPIAKGKSA